MIKSSLQAAIQGVAATVFKYRLLPFPAIFSNTHLHYTHHKIFRRSQMATASNERGSGPSHQTRSCDWPLHGSELHRGRDCWGVGNATAPTLTGSPPSVPVAECHLCPNTLAGISGDVSRIRKLPVQISHGRIDPVEIRGVVCPTVVQGVHIGLCPVGNHADDVIAGRGSQPRPSLATTVTLFSQPQDSGENRPSAQRSVSRRPVVHHGHVTGGAVASVCPVMVTVRIHHYLLEGQQRGQRWRYGIYNVVASIVAVPIVVADAQHGCRPSARAAPRHAGDGIRPPAPAVTTPAPPELPSVQLHHGAAGRYRAAVVVLGGPRHRRRVGHIPGREPGSDGLDGLRTTNRRPSRLSPSVVTTTPLSLVASTVTSYYPSLSG